MSRRVRLILLLATGAVLAGCLAASAILAVRLASGTEIEWELARIREQGAPAAPAELDAPPCPGAKNAATLYAEAFADMRRLGIESAVETFVIFCCTRDPEVDLRLSSEVRALLPRYARVTSLGEKAARLPFCRFPIEWAEGRSATTPQYRYVKLLAAIVGARAIVESREGSGDEALRLIGTAFKMSDSLKDEPAMRAQFERIAIVGQTSSVLRKCLAHGGFHAAQARRLLATISGIDLADSVRIAVWGERALGIGVFDDLKTPGSAELEPPVTAACGILQRALANADELAYLRTMAELVRASRLPYRELQGLVAPCEAPLPRWAVVSPALVPPLDFAACRRDQAIAELAGSQAALALELFRLRFGRYPTRLADLDADSARRLRSDPFSGRPLVYRHGGTGYVLYSIGPDLRDDGGAPFCLNPSPGAGDILWKAR